MASWHRSTSYRQPTANFWRAYDGSSNNHIKTAAFPENRAKLFLGQLLAPVFNPFLLFLSFFVLFFHKIFLFFLSFFFLFPFLRVRMERAAQAGVSGGAGSRAALFGALPGHWDWVSPPVHAVRRGARTGPARLGAQLCRRRLQGFSKKRRGTAARKIERKKKKEESEMKMWHSPLWMSCCAASRASCARRPTAWQGKWADTAKNPRSRLSIDAQFPTGFEATSFLACFFQIIPFLNLVLVVKKVPSSFFKKIY